eukprot:TRINITY_DN13712_c0_g1_i1.p1 TRINITY_DN13712_c0_g1~~TRINITY_DN13712_c0_g1_i1.p1  ORF type:complete len:342 (-),score=47.65 TRINITY_DN13712_c0_g1_i1:316-1341(-)
MATFKSYQVQEANGPFKEVQVPKKDPPAGYVRVRVYACGVCHSDSFVKTAGYPGITLPRSPGHEVAGKVDAIGPDVNMFKPGDRVGVGWFGGCCRACSSCLGGDFMNCIKLQVTGISFDGGYSEYIIVPEFALARIPDSLSYVEAAPLMCAGVTVFNGLRNSGARAGEVVGVQGLGGLGHLAVQYAAKMGFHVVAFSRGEDKKELAMKLGAHTYIDTSKPDFVDQAQALGGCRVIIATATSGKAMSDIAPCLGKRGELIIAGAPHDNITVHPFLLIGKCASIVGIASGTGVDSQAGMVTAALHGVRSTNEVYPVDQVSEAYDRMMSGKATFRVVIDWGVQE